ncbi:MAG: hypothetical protein HS114_29430 [Anaerolineales bacterium]|nr:hypothetical protein [Anaerolineales bacterium]
MFFQWLPTLMIIAAIFLLGGLFLTMILGIVVINERQVGIVVKKFSSRGLPPGQLIALHGESGYQADTLAPGWHFGYWPWQYTVVKAPITVVPQGEIALVVAADGSPIPPQRILGKVVECDNFQDARQFLVNGGEKGRQLGLLTAGTYRINSAQAYTVLDFLSARSERQAEATEHIRAAIRVYDVQAIDTLIGDILPPAELMQTQTDRKIAEEQRKTYEVQQEAQQQRQQLVRETAMADIQNDMVKSEQGVQIAEMQANAQIKQATGAAEATRLQAMGEAEAIRAIGNAKAEAHRAGVQALGSQGYTALQLMQIVGDRNVRVVPDVAVNGSGQAGLVEGMLGLMLRGQTNGSAKPVVSK